LDVNERNAFGAPFCLNGLLLNLNLPISTFREHLLDFEPQIVFAVFDNLVGVGVVFCEEENATVFIFRDLDSVSNQWNASPPILHYPKEVQSFFISVQAVVMGRPGAFPWGGNSKCAKKTR
jgi:hypothetical protein